MQIERECVSRGDTCDRDCGKCELVQDTDELLEAYDIVQAALEKFVEKEDFLDDSMSTQDSHMLRMIIDLCAIGRDRFLQINSDFSEEHFNELRQIIINKAVFDSEFTDLIMKLTDSEDEDDDIYVVDKVYMLHHTKPKLIPQNTDQYIVAHCRCPIDTKYGLIIHKDDLSKQEKKSGVCCIHCDNCNTDIYTGFKFEWNVIN